MKPSKNRVKNLNPFKKKPLKQVKPLKITFTSKQERHSTRFGNSLANLAFKATLHGNKKVLRKTEKTLELIKKGETPRQALKLAGLTTKELRTKDKLLLNELKRFSSTARQTRRASPEELKSVESEIQELKKSVERAERKRREWSEKIASDFGIEKESIKHINTPPFFVIKPTPDVKTFAKLHDKQALARTENANNPRLLDPAKKAAPYGDPAMPNFQSVRQDTLLLFPGDSVFHKRRRTEFGIGEGGGGKIGSATLSVTYDKNRRKVLVIDNVQRGNVLEKPSQWSYTEFKDYGELLVLKALEFARKNNIKRVILPTSSQTAKRWQFYGLKEGSKGITEYDKIGKRFNGKKVTAKIKTTNSKPSPLEGWEWKTNSLKRLIRSVKEAVKK